MKHRYKLSMIFASIVTVAVSMVQFGCGAKMDHFKVDRSRKGRGVQKQLNLREINFKTIDSQESVNVMDYMVENNKSYLLMMFGSVQCTSCQEKATYLTNEGLDDHNTFAGLDDEAFEVMGVNIDLEKSMDLVRRNNRVNGFNFIRWSDPRGNTMQDYFLPDGASFGVPLAVLISREGILLTFTNKSGKTIYEIMDEVIETMGLDATGRPTPVPTTRPTPIPTPEDGLWKEDPLRLYGVSVNKCGEEMKKLGEELSYNGMDEQSISIVQVAKRECSGACLDNMQRIREVEEKCASGQYGNITKCSVMTLSDKEDVNLCQDKGYRMGGAEFFDVFKTFFNWDYARSVDNEGYSVVPDLTGPMTLAFNQNGTLVFAKEGAIEGSLDQFISEGDLQVRPQGPDFPFYAKSGAVKLASERQKAKYTVLVTFDVECGGCMAELKALSAAESIVDVCSESDGQCQVFAVETKADFEGRSMRDYHKHLSEVFANEGIKVPLWIDGAATSIEVEDKDLFLNGYIQGMNHATTGYQTVIYDQEGKIIAQMQAGLEEEAKPLTDYVKALIND
jgi:hypothetical protein